MGLEQFFSLFPLLKLLLLVMLFMYIVFAFVLLNQVRVMNRIVTVSPASQILFFIAFIHLAAAISLFFIALAIL